MKKLFGIIMMCFLFASTIALDPFEKLLLEDQKKPSSKKVANNSKPANTQADRSLLEDLKKLIKETKKPSRKLKSKKKSKRTLQEEEEEKSAGQKAWETFAKVLHYPASPITNALSVPTETPGDKVASALGTYGLIGGGLAARHMLKQKKVEIRNLKLKIKARELYIKSVEIGKQELTRIKERVGYDANYFEDKRISMSKFFNNLIDYTD